MKPNLKTYYRIFSCIFLFLLVVIKDSYSQKISEELEINKTYQDWVKAANQKDIEQWSAFLAPGAIFFPPDNPALIGNEAIKDFYAGLFIDDRFSLTCNQDSVEILGSGDFAWSMGHCEATFSDSNGITAFGKTKWVKLWILSPNGKWKCKISSWSSEHKK